MKKYDFQCVTDKLTFDEVYDNKLKQIREVLSENDLSGVLNTAGYTNERHYENLSRENELFKQTNSENKTRFTCICCGKNLTLNHTQDYNYYFQHEYKTYATDCRYYSYEYVENNSIYESESKEHKFAKRFIQQWFASAGINLTSERRIKNALNRPDLQGVMDNKNIVIEIQRSNIHRKKLIERMEEYSTNFNQYYQAWIIVPTSNDKTLIKTISELKHNDIISFSGNLKSLSERRLVYYQNKVGFILDLGLDLNVENVRLLAIQYFEEQSELKGRIFEIKTPNELFCYEHDDSEYNSKNLLLSSKYVYELSNSLNELKNNKNIYNDIYHKIKYQLDTFNLNIINELKHYLHHKDMINNNIILNNSIIFLNNMINIYSKKTNEYLLKIDKIKQNFFVNYNKIEENKRSNEYILLKGLVFYPNIISYFDKYNIPKFDAENIYFNTLMIVINILKRKNYDSSEKLLSHFNDKKGESFNFLKSIYAEQTSHTEQYFIQHIENLYKKIVSRIDIYTQFKNNAIQVKTFVYTAQYGQEKYVIDNRFTGEFEMFIPHNFHKSFVFHLDKYLEILKDKNIEAPVNIYSNQNILINCFNNFYKRTYNEKYNCDFEVKTYGRFTAKKDQFGNSRKRYIINIPYSKKDSINDDDLLDLFFEHAYFIKMYLKYLFDFKQVNKGSNSIIHAEYEEFESLEILEKFTYSLNCEFIITKEEKMNQEYNSKYIQYSVFIDDDFYTKYLKKLNKYSCYFDMTCVLNTDNKIDNYFKNFEYFMIEKTGLINCYLIEKQQLDSYF